MLVDWFISVVGVIVVYLYGKKRSRAFGIFAGAITAIHAIFSPLFLLCDTYINDQYGIYQLFLYYCHYSVFVYYLVLSKPRMRSLLYRIFITVPALWFSSSTMISIPFIFIYYFPLDSIQAIRDIIPPCILFVGFIGMFQSLVGFEEELDLYISTDQGYFTDDIVKRCNPKNKPKLVNPKKFSIIQLTDTHLGPMMSVERLKKICERAVERNPDLILLTGDYMTMDSQRDSEYLKEALTPLTKVKDKVVAGVGNHDYEAFLLVTTVFQELGIPFLIDDQLIKTIQVDGTKYRIQITSADFTWGKRKEHLQNLMEIYPKRPDADFRILLLHDPGAFKHVPHGTTDLILSGHTHGGQVGLVSLGLNLTIISAIMRNKIPDHGFWQKGNDRLYVHRGTGHYGFPLRIGVPCEQSKITIHFGTE